MFLLSLLSFFNAAVLLTNLYIPSHHHFLALFVDILPLSALYRSSPFRSLDVLFELCINSSPHIDVYSFYCVAFHF